MSLPLVKGALVEYDDGFLGSLPNVVVFQFNPETVNRSIVIPPAPRRGGQPRAQPGRRPAD